MMTRVRKSILGVLAVGVIAASLASPAAAQGYGPPPGGPGPGPGPRPWMPPPPPPGGPMPWDGHPWHWHHRHHCWIEQQVIWVGHFHRHQVVRDVEVCRD